MTATLAAASPHRAHAGRVVNVAVHCAATAAAFFGAARVWTVTAHLSSGRVAPTPELGRTLGDLSVLLGVFAVAAVAAAVVIRVEVGRRLPTLRSLAAPAVIVSVPFAGLWPWYAMHLSLHDGCVLNAVLLAVQCTVLAADLVRGYVHALQRL